MTSRNYGSAPEVVATFDFDWSEYLHYLYLPVAMPVASGGIRVPQRLSFLLPLLSLIRAAEPPSRFAYIYVSARHGYASPDNPLNRPGWHADGFGTKDINYVWSDCYPTRFAIQEFVDISDDHVISAEQFEEQVQPDRVVTYPDHTLLRLDPSVIHATPVIPPPGGERRFVKISLSNERYNLLGNSHNYLFDYDWNMWSRSEVRNDPSYAGGDAGPQF